MENPSLPAADRVHSTEPDAEFRFAVGWQRLTRQEFLEAIVVAVLDKLQKHRAELAERAPLPKADLAD
jgi:hypothetical protein